MEVESHQKKALGLAPLGSRAPLQLQEKTCVVVHTLIRNGCGHNRFLQQTQASDFPPPPPPRHFSTRSVLWLIASNLSAEYTSTDASNTQLPTPPPLLLLLLLMLAIVLRSATKYLCWRTLASACLLHVQLLQSKMR